MNKDEELKDVSRRNTLSIEQALKEMTARLMNQQIRIDGLNTGMSAMSTRMNELERIVMLQKVRITGHGPSEG